MISLSFVTVHCGLESDLHSTLLSIYRYCEVKNYEVLVKSCSPILVENFNRVRLLNFGDRGIYDAMNAALDEVKGSHVMFLNSGDALIDILDESLLTDRVHYGSVLNKRTGRFTLAKSIPIFGVMPNHQSYIVPMMYLRGFRYPLRWNTAADCFFKIYLSRKAECVAYKKIIVGINEPGKSGDFSNQDVIHKRAVEMSEILAEFYGIGWALIIRLIYILFYNIKKMTYRV